MKPKFKHNCSSCVFTGHAVINKQAYDFYYHKSNEINRLTSIIARYGSNGPDYESSMVGYVSPLSITAMVGLSLLAKHLEANGANGFWKGELFKDGVSVLSTK